MSHEEVCCNGGRLEKDVGEGGRKRGVSSGLSGKSSSTPDERRECCLLIVWEKRGG